MADGTPIEMSMPERAEKEGLKQTNFCFDRIAESNATEGQQPTTNELQGACVTSCDTADGTEHMAEYSTLPDQHKNTCRARWDVSLSHQGRHCRVVVIS
jgi:hypothetical protein